MLYKIKEAIKGQPYQAEENAQKQAEIKSDYAKQAEEIKKNNGSL